MCYISHVNEVINSCANNNSYSRRRRKYLARNFVRVYVKHFTNVFCSQNTRLHYIQFCNFHRTMLFGYTSCKNVKNAVSMQHSYFRFIIFYVYAVKIKSLNCEIEKTNKKWGFKQKPLYSKNIY